MHRLSNIAPDAAFARRVDLLVERLGQAVAHADTEWQSFASMLSLPLTAATPTVPTAAAIVVGWPADVLKFATRCEEDEFGVVAPIAQEAKPWHRVPTWRDDLTLDLWSMGWTPVDVDRLVLIDGAATVEFLVALMRPTPQNS